MLLRPPTLTAERAAGDVHSATGDGGYKGMTMTVALFSIPAAQPAVKVKPPPAVAAYLLTRENVARGSDGFISRFARGFIFNCAKNY